MAYRDDHEALKARREELRRALDEARSAAEALRDTERRRAALEADLAAVEARITRPDAWLTRIWIRLAVALVISPFALIVLVPGGPHWARVRFQDELECRGMEKPAPEKHGEGVVYEWGVRACFNCDGVRVHADHRVELLDCFLGEAHWSGTVESPEADRLIALASAVRTYSIVQQCGTAHVETTLYGSGLLPASWARRQEIEELGIEVLHQAERRAHAEAQRATDAGPPGP